MEMAVTYMRTDDEKAIVVDGDTSPVAPSTVAPPVVASVANGSTTDSIGIVASWTVSASTTCA